MLRLSLCEVIIFKTFYSIVDSMHAENLFMIFCHLLNFFHNFFEKFFQEYYQSIKQFGYISGPTFCWA